MMPLDSNDVAVLIVLVTALVPGDGASPTCSSTSRTLGAASVAPAGDDEEDVNGEEDGGGSSAEAVEASLSASFACVG